VVCKGATNTGGGVQKYCSEGRAFMVDQNRHKISDLLGKDSYVLTRVTSEISSPSGQCTEVPSSLSFVQFKMEVTLCFPKHCKVHF
jgi:hypothetical protein